MSLHLVSLDCPSCGSALHGEGMDTIFFCSHCGDAAVLEEDGLRMIESTALLPAPGRTAGAWRPAWLLEAEVTVRARFAADRLSAFEKALQETFGGTLAAEIVVRDEIAIVPV